MKELFMHKHLYKILPLLVVLGLFFITGCSPKTYDDTMENLDAEYKGLPFCWGCTIFDALFNAINDIIKVLYIEMSYGALGLLTIIFALWIAFRVGKVLFSFKEPNTNEFWTDFAKMAFAVSFCAVILMNKGTIMQFLSYTITPIFQGAVDFAVAVISKSFSSIGVVTDYSSCTVPFAGDTGKEVLDEGLKETLMCLIYKIQQRLSYGMFFAGKLMYLGFVEFLFAAAVGIVFLLMMFMFPFILVDGIFRIGVMLVLLPVLIAFWPFPLLRRYSTAGWKIFLGSMVHIMILTIFITLMIEVLTDFTAISVGTIDESEELLENIISAPEALVFMVFLAFYAWKFMTRTNLIAAQFSGAKADSQVFNKSVAAMQRMGTNLAKAAATGSATGARMGLGAVRNKLNGLGGGSSKSGGGGKVP